MVTAPCISSFETLLLKTRPLQGCGAALEIARFFVSADGGFRQSSASSSCDANVGASHVALGPLGASPPPLAVSSLALEVERRRGEPAVCRETLASISPVSPSAGPGPAGISQGVPRGGEVAAAGLHVLGSLSQRHWVPERALPTRRDRKLDSKVRPLLCMSLAKGTSCFKIVMTRTLPTAATWCSRRQALL